MQTSLSGSSAAIHELMDMKWQTALSSKVGLKVCLRPLPGRIWVFHHAALDVAFLQQACIAWAGVTPPFIVLDTMQIELAVRKRRDCWCSRVTCSSASCAATMICRDTRHTTRLIDAFATAELLLAIAARLDRKAPLKLAPYLRFI